MMPERIIKIRQQACEKAGCKHTLDYSDPCAKCPDNHFGVYNRKDCQDGTALPSLPKMAFDFVKAVTKDSAAGRPRRTEEEVNQIINTICKPCEFYLEKSNRCSKCGCQLKHKVSMATQHCPLNKW